VNYALALRMDMDADLCLCGELTPWVHEWDWPIEQTLEPYTWGSVQGTIVENGGIVGPAEVVRELPEDTWLDGVQIELGVTGENPSDTNLSLWIGYRVGQSDTTILGTQVPIIGLNEIWTLDLELPEGAELRAGIWYNKQQGEDDWAINRLSWYGRGANPFGFDHEYED
jgi:hypothetical protein